MGTPRPTTNISNIANLTTHFSHSTAATHATTQIDWYEHQANWLIDWKKNFDYIRKLIAINDIVPSIETFTYEIRPTDLKPSGYIMNQGLLHQHMCISKH